MNNDINLENHTYVVTLEDSSGYVAENDWFSTT
jgi:hypothetical protein